MINPENLPVITILCRNLENAVDIKKILKGYQRITYELYTLSETLKYGESADEPDGERIYRQIWQFPGWPTCPSPDAAGRDIIDVIRSRPHLTKNDIGIRVWDLTNVPYQNIYRPHKETLDVEGELIKRHIQQFKRAPIGNKVEQRRVDRGINPIKKNTTMIGEIYHSIFEEN